MSMFESFANFNWWLVVAALLFILLDFISGFIQAVANKELHSDKLRKGLFHKCGFILAIVFGLLCEWSIQFVDLGFDVPIAIAICAYIILTEITSIIENLGKLSPELASSSFMSIFKRDEK